MKLGANSGIVVSNARKFVAKVNQVARQHSQAVEPATVSAGAASIPDQIRQVAELRDQGILSTEEFEAKKADLLKRL